jgi:hypothetical protein
MRFFSKKTLKVLKMFKFIMLQLWSNLTKSTYELSLL